MGKVNVGMMVEEVQKNIIRSRIIFAVPSFLLTKGLWVLINLLDGDIVLGDFCLLQPLISALTYLLLQF